MAESYGARRRPSWLTWAPRLWIAAVVAILIWQTVAYRGLFSILAEWEYRLFGTNRPTATYLLLLALLSLPMLLLLPIWRRYMPKGQIAEGVKIQLMLERLARLRFIFFSIACIALLGAVSVAVYMLMLPSDAGSPSQLAVSETISAPAPGLTDLHGTILLNKTATFTENFGFFRRSTKFAPAVGTLDGLTKFRFFIEVPASLANVKQAQAQTVHGILREGGLPGDIRHLYQNSGFTVTPGYFVLYQSSWSMARIYASEACELAILAVLFGLLGSFMTVRRRRLLKVQQDLKQVDGSV